MQKLDTLKKHIWATIAFYCALLWQAYRTTKGRLIIWATIASSTIVPVFAQSSTTTEITEIVLAWMPLIIVFAMLGMVLGMLKKFGKF